MSILKSQNSISRAGSITNEIMVLFVVFADTWQSHVTTFKKTAMQMLLKRTTIQTNF